MHKFIVGLASLAAVALPAIAPAHAQGTVKIGLIMTYSGQFADVATMMDNAIKLYMKQHGDTVAGKKIELIRKDSGTGGTAPDVAKRLAQELAVRDKVDIIAGFSLTPEALAVANVVTEAKKPTVITNAATAIITTRSPYFVRTSAALPQPIGTLGAWAAKNGIKQAYTMVSDYGPGNRFRKCIPDSLQTRRRSDHRLGALSSRQPGLLGLRPAPEGRKFRGRVHLCTGRRAAGGARQSAGGTRDHAADHEGAEQRRAH